MSCRKYVGYLKCNEFLFVDNQLKFGDSVKYCKDHNYELAKINIKYGDAEDDELNKVLTENLKNHYRIGLKFENKDGTWYGTWSNGEVYRQAIGDIGLFSLEHINDDCYEVVINKDLESLYLIDCNRKYPPLCRKPVIPITDITQFPVISNPYPASTSSPPNSFPNTPSLSWGPVPNSQPTGSVLIGLCATFSILFLIAVILLAYICYNKKKVAKSKREKSHNVADIIEPGSVDGNEVTYMEVNECNKDENENEGEGNEGVENEEVGDEPSASAAVYAVVNKKNKLKKSEEDGRSSNEDCDEEQDDKKMRSDGNKKMRSDEDDQDENGQVGSDENVEIKESYSTDVYTLVNKTKNK